MTVGETNQIRSTADLIKFLRTSTSSAFNKIAADRIERLVKELDKQVGYKKDYKVVFEETSLQLHEAEAKLSECEARLGKALEALDKISCNANIKIARFARDTLNKLGGKDD